MSIFKNDRDAAQLSRVYERCQAQESRQYLPTSPDVEVIYKLDPIKISEAAQSGLFPFEEELGIEPSGSLARMLDGKGSRDITITNDYQADHSHDTAWSGGGGGTSWLPIFSASVSASSESHFRQSLSNIESISISCDHLAEYWVRRRDWFDSTIFENKYVADYLKNRPDTAALLALCVSSVMIARGLKITYTFKSENDTAIWSSWSSKASGGFTVFGFQIGASSGSSGSQSHHTIDKKERSVTFFDDPEVCRLVALRASQVIPTVKDEVIAFTGKRLEESMLGAELIKGWLGGKSYGQIPDTLASTFRLLPFAPAEVERVTEEGQRP